MIARFCIGLLATGVVVVEFVGTYQTSIISTKGPIRGHIEKLAKEMDTDSQDGQFQRSYGMPHPPDIHGRYEGHAIVIEIITCFGPKFFKIKALYVEDDPILVDPYPLLISYALDAFGRLPDI
ncbi:MAG: hypothetical protein M1839_005430 [Geoglossum umbratile]|nr:MAG: hypothetical protein M1839_005430 [Geoglossum umbratile]